jgi:hypothetical protein
MSFVPLTPEERSFLYTAATDARNLMQDNQERMRSLGVDSSCYTARIALAESVISKLTNEPTAIETEVIHDALARYREAAYTVFISVIDRDQDGTYYSNRIHAADRIRKLLIK